MSHPIKDAIDVRLVPRKEIGFRTELEKYKLCLAVWVYVTVDRSLPERGQTTREIEHGKRIILERIYGPLRPKLYELRSALYDQDVQKCDGIITQIEDFLNGTV